MADDIKTTPYTYLRVSQLKIGQHFSKLLAIKLGVVFMKHGISSYKSKRQYWSAILNL